MNLTNTCRTCLQNVMDEAVPITTNIYEFLELELRMKRIPRQHPQLPQSVCFDCYRNLVAFKRFYIQCRDAEEFFITKLEQMQYALEESRDKEYELVEASPTDAGETKVNNDDELIDFIEDSEEFEEMGSQEKNDNLSGYKMFTVHNRNEDLARSQNNVDSTVSFITNSPEHQHLQSRDNEESDFTELIDDKSFITVEFEESIKPGEDSNLCLLDSKVLIDGNIQHTQKEIFKDSEIEESFNKRKRRFQCNLCDKSFSSRYDLLMHENIHNGIKPFVCEVCGKCFRQKNILRTHEALHFGKNIKCDECGKTFARKSQLIIHNRMHRNEKPFKCDYDDSNCGASFRERQHLISHQKTHTGIREHHCEHCSRAFYHRKGLLGHVRDVHGSVCYQCDLCPRSFNKPYKIRKHMEAAHDLQFTSVSHFKKSCPVTTPFDGDDDSNYLELTQNEGLTNEIALNCSQVFPISRRAVP